MRQDRKDRRRETLWQSCFLYREERRRGELKNKKNEAERRTVDPWPRRGPARVSDPGTTLLRLRPIDVTVPRPHQECSWAPKPQKRDSGFFSFLRLSSSSLEKCILSLGELLVSFSPNMILQNCVPNYRICKLSREWERFVVSLLCTVLQFSLWHWLAIFLKIIIIILK